MQPPPQARFNMFNTPNEPRNRFDWSVLSESFELLKINTGTFIAFSLIGLIAGYTISQIVNAPQFLLLMNPSSVENGSFLALSMVFGIFANLALLGVLGFVRSGIMILSRRVMSRKLPDIPEGFQQLNRFFTYAGANLAGWVIGLPFMIISGIMAGNQMQNLMTQQRPDPATILPMLVGAGSSYLLGAIVLLLTYPLFCLAVPAAFVENLNFAGAVKRSFELGKKYYGSLLLFSVLAGIMQYASLMCCCLPFLFVYPWITVSYLLIFRDVANVPLIAAEENQGQTNYPREYGMTMPNFEPGTTATPSPEPPAPPNPEPPTDPSAQ